MTHKKYFFYLFLIVNMMLSCERNETSLDVTANQLEFGQMGEEKTLTIESDGDWSIYNIPEWLSATRQSGINTQTVTFAASRNVTGMDREQVLTIKTNDSRNTHAVRILQYGNASGRVFSVDDTSLKYFNGSTSEKEDSIVLSSSVRWRIYGPQWMAIDYKGEPGRMEGELREGSGTIYLRCRQPNSGADARQDYVTIQTEVGDKTITIPVVQLGIYDVKCVNMRVLSDGLWTEFKYGKDAQYIRFNCLEGRYTAEQLDGTKDDFVQLQAIVKDGLKSDTDYTIITNVAFTSTLYSTKANIEYIHTPSEINQPRAIIEDVKLGDDGKWHCNFVMNQYAKGYYYIVFNTNNRFKMQYALWFENYIKNGKLTLKTKNGSSLMKNNSATILTWAVGHDGKLSGVVDEYRIYPTDNASAPQWKQTMKQEYVGTIDAREVEIGFSSPITNYIQK